MEMIAAPAGYGILNDTYNANPASMAAALHTLAQMQARVSAAILGDMLELGDSSEAAHREVGRLAAECRVHYLGLVGDFALLVAEAAILAGNGGGTGQGVCRQRAGGSVDRGSGAGWETWQGGLAPGQGLTWIEIGDCRLPVDRKGLRNDGDQCTKLFSVS